jgi:oligopeptidase A
MKSPIRVAFEAQDAPQAAPAQANPLLDAVGLPAFEAIRAEHVGPALDRLLADADAALEHAVSDRVPTDYDALSAALDLPVERLRRAWGAVGHLHAVADTPALRAAYTDNLARVTDFYTRLGADPRLYAKTKALARTPLTPPRRKAVADSLRDAVLGGAELQGAARERFAAIQERAAELSQRFGEHVLDATDGWTLDVDIAQLDGVPDDVRQSAREAARAAGHDGCRLSLRAPVLGPVMQHARDRTLRRTLYTAHATRASELADAALDNSALMREILALRREQAMLLGHPSFAHLSLVPKMAESPDTVLAFLLDLARRARPRAEAEAAELAAFAASALGIAELHAWDRSYAGEQLRQHRYAFSEQEVRSYFAVPRVLDGLLRLVETLFDLHIRPDDAPIWHDSAAFYRVERGGQLLGHFYLDLYARPGKQPGAWMDDLLPRWRHPGDGSLQRPVACLVCNFAAPGGGRPSLLDHDDVLTLFHEFGHGLHHLLTQVEDLAVSGISGVEWDAVELPSQFMENFAWQWPVIERITAHVDTGEPMPRALFDRMVAARHFQTGLKVLRGVEFALFDLRLHMEPDAADRVLAIADDVRREVAIWPAPSFDRYPHSFTHIFDGGYAAGYYGYDWAELLAADAFAAFEECGLFDPATGRRFREAVLEVGGSRPALESFTAFRGRAPRIDALLRHRGLLESSAELG